MTCAVAKSRPAGEPEGRDARSYGGRLLPGRRSPWSVRCSSGV